MAGYQRGKNKNVQIVAVVLAMMLILYLVSQLWGFANIKMRTEQVVEDTVYDFVRADAMVFRSEEMIPQVASGVTVYNYADGEEVAKDQEVAAVYQDKTVSMVNNQIDQLQKELKSLQDAQTVKATRYSAITNLSSEINDQAGKIVDACADGVVEGISDQKDSLVSMLNRKKIALGEEDTFADRIYELQSEISYLEQTKEGEKGVSITAPAAGYFCKEVDGYESVLSADLLEDMTYEQYQQLESASAQTVTNAAGKIIKTHVWYLAVDLDQEEVQKFELDAKVKLDFHFANGQTSSATVVNIIPDEQHKNAVVVFECKDINEQLLGVRKQSVDITFTTYSGLRISASALYHEQNIPGVYVLDKTTIRFKPVEILKDQGSFILCEPKQGTDEEHTLNRLDLVIVESGGVSMRDGTTLDEDMVKGVESSNAGS